jgi:DNA-binding NarL/FixJ family response regulator
MIKLLLADDHALVRCGLKQIFALTTDVQVAGEAAHGAAVLDGLRELVVDVLLLDLNMPGISGADLIQRVKAHWPHLPILVLSMHNEPQVAARMLKAGANGFITKDCEPDILLAAIRKVAAGGKYIAPELAQAMVFDAMHTTQRPLHHLLSERERVIFKLLTSGKSVNEIALQLSISNKTVSTHKTRLMEKLGTSNMADLMRYAMAQESPA